MAVKDAGTPDDGTFRIKFGNDRQAINLDEVRRRALPFMPDNGHAWVIQTVYALDDPEQALDEMNLTAENFIGVTAICCLLCTEKYVSTNRFHKCPQHPNA